MVNIDEIITRIMEFKELESYRQVGDLLGLSPADFSNRKRRGTLAPKVLEWAINENVNIDWLFRGMQRENWNEQAPYTEIFALLDKLRPLDVEDIYRECQRRVEILELAEEVRELRNKMKDLL